LGGLDGKRHPDGISSSGLDGKIHPDGISLDGLGGKRHPDGNRLDDFTRKVVRTEPVWRSLLSAACARFLFGGEISSSRLDFSREKGDFLEIIETQSDSYVLNVN
jgi:hypothetical protein